MSELENVVEVHVEPSTRTLIVIRDADPSQLIDVEVHERGSGECSLIVIGEKPSAMPRKATAHTPAFVVQEDGSFRSNPAASC
jgi:hypothetical protein